MRFTEFAEPNPLVPKIIAVSDQLKSDMESGQIDSNMSVDELLGYFQQYDVVLDKAGLINMVKNPPLKNIISNIKGDQVVFKGFDDMDQPTDDGENQKIVKSMAQSALK